MHFINKNSDEKFVDNTWGWTYEFYDYYFLRELYESEYNNISDLLNDVRKIIYDINCNFIEKLIYKDYELI